MTPHFVDDAQYWGLTPIERVRYYRRIDPVLNRAFLARMAAIDRAERIQLRVILVIEGAIALVGILGFLASVLGLL